jgi:hypothetical protein
MRKRCALAVIGLVLLPSLARGQMVSGQVTDSQVGMLAGVAVTASTGNPGEPARTAITDTAGRYRLVNLRPDVYTLTFAKPGARPFATKTIDLTRVRSATVDMVVPTRALTAAIRGQQASSRRDDRACLHGDGESTMEALRRNAALDAMRLIDQALSSPSLRDRSWDGLGRSSVVGELLSKNGVMGDLARRIQWGSPEPLSGWGLAYVVNGALVRYALTDLTDPCSFAYSSADPQVVSPGRVPPS